MAGPGFKRWLSNLLRQAGLLYLTDYMMFWLQKVRNYKKNQSFKKANPGIVLPPDYLVYESFQLDYRKYYTDSIETARWLTGIFKTHAHLYNANILDWGCGPGRIIRHLPDLAGAPCFIYGTDCNPRTIAWCRHNIPGVQFSQNSMDPPLDFNDQFFHIIYGISIFTHLSEPMHRAWAAELHRLLAPEGICLLTTQGEAFLQKLTGKEQQSFREGRLVVRGKVKEGHRIWSAFQPESYIMELFAGFSLVSLRKGEASGRPQQDVWVFRKA
ncbi:MAG TPA: class I SAM-dependent methyltransferase [Bacteroidales bacterium]|nr:class I SAM-dependent methyltransferase [Bacteroidales bacterium]HSA43521.1 class I SAM-dependent methyltransferase [Bacteroidales bacterium]